MKTDNFSIIVALPHGLFDSEILNFKSINYKLLSGILKKKYLLVYLFIWHDQFYCVYWYFYVNVFNAIEKVNSF